MRVLFLVLSSMGFGSAVTLVLVKSPLVATVAARVAEWLAANVLTRTF